MAIKIAKTEDNGIVTEYHRIALLSIDVNNHNTILVHSYLNEAGRQIEKDYAAGKYDSFEADMVKFPYVNAEYLGCDYDGEMTIAKAYEYLKTLPEFEGAIDV